MGHPRRPPKGGLHLARLDTPNPGLRAREYRCHRKLLHSTRIPLVRYYVTRSTHDVDDTPEIGRYSDPPLLVMASLADGPKHGHAMIEDIFRMSGTRLGPGTLYGAIARLERESLSEALPPDQRRQPYRLTAAPWHNQEPFT
jgi:hypothetical protein